MKSNVDNSPLANQNPKHIESLFAECTSLRLKYDSCFNDWFKQEFLKTDKTSVKNNICESEFAEYQKCLFKNIAEMDKKAKTEAEKTGNSGALSKGLLESIKEAEKEIEGFEKK